MGDYTPYIVVLVLLIMLLGVTTSLLVIVRGIKDCIRRLRDDLIALSKENTFIVHTVKDTKEITTKTGELAVANNNVLQKLDEAINATQQLLRRSP